MTADIKPLAGLDRITLSEVIPLSSPFSVFIFPTTHCNFKCIYCAHSLSSREKKEKFGLIPQHMDLDTFERTLCQLKEFPEKIKVISLTGHGEPLMHPQISQMVQLVKNADIAERVEIITNGSLLTPKFIDELIDAGLDTIRISMQGLSEKKYLETCGYSLNFNQFIENVRYLYLHKKRCNVFVKILDIALNDDEDELFYSIFGEISDRMFIEQCRPVYYGVRRTDGLSVLKDRYGRKHEERVVCPLCFYMLGIFPNGDVVPCDAIYKPVLLGNIHTHNLLEIWSGDTLREFQMMQLKKQRKKHPQCSKCCAPDDVAHPEDALDEASDRVLPRMK